MSEYALIRKLFSGAVSGGLAFHAGMAQAQDFPTKSIHIITGEVGGGLDPIARIIAQGLSRNLGHQAIVENKGGSAAIPAQALVKAPPDGYTLLYYGNSIWLLPLLQDNLPYDPIKNFSPITLAVSSPNVLVVFPGLAVDSVKDLISLAKAKPGQLNYASGISGSSNHLAAELFKAMADVNIVRIPYKGTGAGIRDLISGSVQIMFPPVSGVSTLIRAGKLRALAITSRTRSVLFPELNTMDASGLPGYESEITYGVFAPANTPAPIVATLNREIVRTLTSDQINEQLLNIGLVVVGSSPEQLANAMKSEIGKMSKVVKSAGIRAD